jgi:hypothetical protein
MPAPDARRSQRWRDDPARGPEHLRDWLEIVRVRPARKASLERFGRLFELQHFWRVLHGRYASACYWRKGRLERVAADYLCIEAEVVHRDLVFLGKRLGPKWHLPQT